MEIAKKDYSITLDKYAIENILTDKYFWLWSKRYVKNVKNMNRMVHNLLASKCSSRGVIYQFGLSVLCNISEAHLLDKDNGNTLWYNSTKIEVALL